MSSRKAEAPMSPAGNPARSRSASFTWPTASSNCARKLVAPAVPATVGPFNVLDALANRGRPLFAGARRMMKLDKDTGTIEVGKRADLAIFDADPLADITNIRTASRVVVNGALYNSATLLRAAGYAIK